MVVSLLTAVVARPPRTCAEPSAALHANLLNGVATRAIRARDIRSMTSTHPVALTARVDAILRCIPQRIGIGASLNGEAQYSTRPLRVSTLRRWPVARWRADALRSIVPTRFWCSLVAAHAPQDALARATRPF